MCSPTPAKIGRTPSWNTYMPFNTQQSSHQQLRSIIVEKTSKVVFWVGSGLSADANLPTWKQLKKRLVRQLREKASEISDADSRPLKSAADHAEREANCWIAFNLLRKRMGPATYRSAIREALRPALTALAQRPTAMYGNWVLRESSTLTWIVLQRRL